LLPCNRDLGKTAYDNENLHQINRTESLEPSDPQIFISMHHRFEEPAGPFNMNEKMPPSFIYARTRKRADNIFLPTAKSYRYSDLK